jgi:hypothetical protein
VLPVEEATLILAVKKLLAEFSTIRLNSTANLASGWVIVISWAAFLVKVQLISDNKSLPSGSSAAKKGEAIKLPDENSKATK